MTKNATNQTHTAVLGSVSSKFRGGINDNRPALWTTKYQLSTWSSANPNNGNPVVVPSSSLKLWREIADVRTGTAELQSVITYTGDYSLGVNITNIASGASLCQAMMYTYTESPPGDYQGWHYLRDVMTVMGVDQGQTWPIEGFNRLRFWMLVPPDVSEPAAGAHNFIFGTYTKDNNSDQGGQESDNGHWYHQYHIPYTGQWHQVIVDWHPHHQRSWPGGYDHGSVQYPTPIDVTITAVNNYTYTLALTIGGTTTNVSVVSDSGATTLEVAAAFTSAINGDTTINNYVRAQHDTGDGIPLQIFVIQDVPLSVTAATGNLVVDSPTTPVNDRNYFDQLRRIYFDVNGSVGGAGYPINIYIDHVEVYADPNHNNEDVDQIYAVDGVYRPTTKTFRVGFSRIKSLPAETQYEVRYAHSDIHALGWSSATPAPNGTFACGGNSGGYNLASYSTNDIDTEDSAGIYFAIKRSGAEHTKFRQIYIPCQTTGRPGV